MKKEVIVIAVLLLAVIVIIGGFVLKRPGKEEPLPEPPTGEVLVYKGFWMPAAFYYPYDSHTMTDAKLAKETGANIVSLGPTIKINSRGEVKYAEPWDSNRVDGQLKKLAKMYYDEGIRLHVVIEIYYEEEFSSEGGEPSPIPRDIASKQGFLDKFNLILEEMAGFAEKYHAEMFSPMNEVDYKLGSATASAWSQEILPRIKKNYNGKVVFKGELFREEDSDRIDFAGYDVIGCSMSPREYMSDFENDVSSMITKMQSWAARDNVPEIMITEFGIWGGSVGLDDETKALVHKIVFEKGQGKVKGFIVFDPPADQGWSLKGTKSLEEITTGFKNNL